MDIDKSMALCIKKRARVFETNYTTNTTKLIGRINIKKEDSI